MSHEVARLLDDLAGVLVEDGDALAHSLFHVTVLFPPIWMCFTRPSQVCLLSVCVHLDHIILIHRFFSLHFINIVMHLNKVFVYSSVVFQWPFFSVFEVPCFELFYGFKLREVVSISKLF